MEIKLEQTQANNIIQNNPTVLLDFYADWCGPCQTLLPTIHKLAAELKDEVIIKKVNVDDNQELADMVGCSIEKIRTEKKNGNLVARYPSAKKKFHPDDVESYLRGRKNN